MSRSLYFLAAVSLALTGCDLINKQDAQHDDSRNPYYKQAQQDLDNNNPAAAAADYEAALGANPKLAGAHYQLGIIYGEKLSDPVGSIFHFKRYLELAPNSDQAEKVKELIDKQSQTFAAGLPSSPTQSADEYAKLQSDNAALKKQVEDATHTITQLQAQLAQAKHHHDAVAATPPPASSPAPAVAADGVTPSAPVATSEVAVPVAAPATPATPPRALPLDATNTVASPASPEGTPAAATGASRTYTVVKGDSIWKIAHKMYPGDTKNGVDKITEANKDAINGKLLKIGQVLIIP